MLKQLQAVHIGHPNVGDDQIDGLLLQKSNGAKSVVGRTGNRNVSFVPLFHCA